MKRDRQTEHAYSTLMPGDVRDYLLEHPDFLIDNGDLLSSLVPPVERRGEGVQDFQRYMLARLQDNFTAIKDEHDDLMQLMQEQMQRQNRINAVILLLMDLASFEETLNFIANDMAILLEQEAAGLFLEAGDTLKAGTYSGLHVVQKGFVDEWLAGRDIELAEQSRQVPELFGDKAPHIRSQALVRLIINDDLPPGMLALGHREAMYYATGIATEQIECLGGVVERCLRKWLVPPV